MLLGKKIIIIYTINLFLYYSFSLLWETEILIKSITYRFSYLRDCCLNCRQCNSGNDVMCHKRVMFPEGNNNAFAHGVVCKEK